MFILINKKIYFTKFHKTVDNIVKMICGIWVFYSFSKLI